MQESGLPGPRGNLELAHAVAQEGDRARFLRYVDLDAEQAPVNTPAEFLAFCGTLGLEKLLASGQIDLLELLRRQASDRRWRTREAVAQALQLWGDVDLDGCSVRWKFGVGTLLEKRLPAAALCEPRLLVDLAHTERVLLLLQRITASLLESGRSQKRGLSGAPQGVGLSLSVAVAAHRRGRQGGHRILATQQRPRRALDDEGEPEQEAARTHGCLVGGSGQGSAQVREDPNTGATLPRGRVAPF